MRHAYRISVLEHGEVVQAGTHEELIDAGGLYAALWRLTGEAASHAGPFRPDSVDHGYYEILADTHHR